MITILKETLAKRLQIDSRNLIIEPFTRSPIQISRSNKVIFLLTILPEHSNYILLTAHVNKKTTWNFKDFLLSLKILETLKLKYSLFPSESDYFRIFHNDTAYDVVMIKKGKGQILNDYFEMLATNPQNPSSFNNLSLALKAFAKALAELHSAKLRHNSVPGKGFLISSKHWTHSFIEKFPLWNLSLPIESYRSFLNNLEKDCRRSDFLTGVTHYDPKPQNILYSKESDQITLLDNEGIALSLDRFGKGVGPIAWDFIKAMHGITKAIFYYHLPVSITSIFFDTYQLYMQENFPSTSQILYYSCLQSMKTLCDLSASDSDAYLQALWQKETQNIESIVAQRFKEQYDL